MTWAEKTATVEEMVGCAHTLHGSNLLEEPDPHSLFWKPVILERPKPFKRRCSTGTHWVARDRLTVA